MKLIFKLIILLLISSFLITLKNAQADELVISGNGDSSQNQISVNTDSQTQVTQNNDAKVTNDVDTKADTGNNQASDNSGGDTTIATGNVEVKTTVENSTNVSIVDDICCPTSPSLVTISDNGSGSQNNIDIKQADKSTINISQNANIQNDIYGNANSGNNQASKNQSDTMIITGDIKATDSIQNKDVNITNTSIGQGLENLSVSISGNGADSATSIKFTQENAVDVFIDNNVTLSNSSVWDLNTGNNFADGNLGDVSILTGSIELLQNIENGPINISNVIISCCQITPTVTPTPTVSPTPTPTGGPTSTPTPTSGPGGGETTSSGSSGGAAAAPAGEVLGASAVSESLPAAGSNWLLAFTVISTLIFGLGFYLRFLKYSKFEIRRLRLP